MKVTVLFVLTLAVFLSASQQALAAQTAVVSVPEAIVYADKEMTSAIGKLTMGKKIRVGQVARNRGQVLPVNVSGRIAWVRIKDLYLEDHIWELKNRKFNRHDELIEELEKDRMRHKNKSISATWGYFQAGRDWKATGTAVNNGERQTYGNMIDGRFGLPLKFTETQSVRLGANYVTIDDRVMHFKALGGALDWSMLLGEFREYSAEFTATFLAYPYASWRILGDNLTGSAVGSKFFIDTFYYFTKKFGLKFDFGYTYLRLLGFKLDGGVNIENARLDGVIAGAHLNLGLILRF